MVIGAVSNLDRFDGGVRPTCKRPRGFSIVEVIVVLVLLGILAAAVAPRLATLTGRQTRADAQAVAELLSIAARRDSLTNQPVAIEYDAGQARLRMLTRRGVTAEWRSDPLAPDAELKASFVESAETDGMDLNPERFRVEFAGALRRPSLSIVLADQSKRESWRVSLAPGASRAVITPASVRITDGSIDLDAAGKGEEPW